MPTNVRLDELRSSLASPLPQPEPAAGAESIVAWALEHFRTLPDQAIGATISPTDAMARLGGPPPETATPFEQVLRQFDRDVATFAFRVNHPRFLAFVPGAPAFASVLGDWLCAASNFFAGVWLEAAGPAAVELVVLDWFRQFLGMPPTTEGLLTGGGSEANLTALVVARERLSFEDRSRAVIYLSEQRHWSMDRGAKVIGLSDDQLRPVPADSEFRLTPETLSEAVRLDRERGRLPWLVVANAGATNTGTVDRLRSLADYCRREQLWLHIDAAYGWAAVLTPEGASDLDGIGEADSVTFDPHKWFGQTFEAGGLLVRDGSMLERTFAIRPDYMQDVAPAGAEVNFADRGIALTRRFRALKIWLSIQVLGLGWFRRLAEHCQRLAEFAQRALEAHGRFEILCPRRLSIVCFRYVPAGPALIDADLDALNLAMLEELRREGFAFLSSTRLHGRVAVRFCFVNSRTTASDVEGIIDRLGMIGAKLCEANHGRLG